MDLVTAASQKEAFLCPDRQPADPFSGSYSPEPFSPMNQCSLFLNKTLKVVNEP